MSRIFSLCFRFSKSILLFYFLLLVFILPNLSQIRIDTSIDRLLTNNEEALSKFNRAIKFFGSDNSTLLVIEDENLFKRDNLVLLKKQVQNLQKLKLVSKVESAFNSSLIRRDQEGSLSTLALFDKIPDTQEEIDSSLQVALANPTYNRVFIEPSLKTMIIIITGIKEEGSSNHFNEELYDQIYSVQKTLESRFSKVFQIGKPRIITEMSGGIIHDQMILLPLVIFVIALCMLLSLKSISAGVIPILTGSVSLSMTLYMMIQFNIPVDMIISTVPLMIFVIGATEDTHIVSEYLVGLGKYGDKGRAVAYSGSKMGYPVLLTTLTTILGFFTIAINEITMLKDFGIVCGVGLFFNFIVTITLLPAYLSLFGEKKPRVQGKSQLSGKFEAFADKVFTFINRKQPLWLTLVFVFYGAGCLYFTQFVSANNNGKINFKENSKFRTDIKSYNSRYHGETNFFLVLETDKTDGFIKPDYLKRVFELYQWVEQDKFFGTARTFADKVAVLNREIREGEPDQFKIPDNPEMIAQYMLFFSRDDLSSFLTSDYKKTNLMISFDSDHSSKTIKNIERLNKKIKELISGTDIKFYIAGKGVMAEQASLTIINSQVKSLVTLFLLIFIVMAILFRSPRIAVVSILPNALPVLGCFGLLGLTGVPLNVGTCIIAVISIGIAVDDTIHFFTRFYEIARESETKEEAVRLSLRKEFRPIVVTSFSLAIGLGLTGFSDFVPIIALGTFTGFVLLLAMVSDLFITPKLLLVAPIKEYISVFDLVSTKVSAEMMRSPLFKGFTARDVKRFILSGKVIEIDQVGGSKNLELKKNYYLLIEGSCKYSIRNRRALADEGMVDLAQLYEGSLIGKEKTVDSDASQMDFAPGSKLLELSEKFLSNVEQTHPTKASKLLKNLKAQVNL